MDAFNVNRKRTAARNYIGEWSDDEQLPVTACYMAESEQLAAATAGDPYDDDDDAYVMCSWAMEIESDIAGFPLPLLEGVAE